MEREREIGCEREIRRKRETRITLLYHGCSVFLLLTAVQKFPITGEEVELSLAVKFWEVNGQLPPSLVYNIETIHFTDIYF